ncbi:MAG: sigma-70 family RNA polymerase sigma factor [Planctomycetota bacterium]
MAHGPVAFDPDELLAEIGWVRALALRVVADAHVADDLAQDAMLVALRGGADGPRPESRRRWLAAVVRHLSRTRRRGERRRVRREAEVAKEAVAPATVELIERAAMQRELVGALLELDEPYRSTLLLRFFEGCSQRDIATRLGVPTSTVGSRIAEGLKRLRRRFGVERSGAGALIAWLQRPAAAGFPAWLPGVALMALQTKLLFGGVFLAGVVIATVVGWGGGAAGEPVAAAEPAASLPASPVVDAVVASDARQRVTSVPSAPGASGDRRAFHEIPEHAGLENRRTRVRGQVIDLSGTPVGGVEVRVSGWNDKAESTTPGVTTDAMGKFETEGLTPLTVRVHDERYATVMAGAIERPPSGDAIVVAALRVPLGGVVVDADGAPIAGAHITVQADVAADLPRTGRDVTTSRLVVPEAHSDELGLFRLDGVAMVEKAHLVVRAPGFILRILPMPVGGDAAMVVVLERGSDRPFTITGHVVLEDGSPAVGAYVSTGTMASTADASGYFVIDLEPWVSFRADEDKVVTVTAVRDGLRPTSRTLSSIREARASGWPDDIVLELGGAPLTIRGVVVDEEGEPVRGVLVELAEPSSFGFIHAEGMPASFGVPRTQEQLAGGGEARTHAGGGFTLGGLLDRPYALRVLQRPSLLATVTPPIDAGAQDARIVLDRRGLGTIAGRIVDRHGRGVGGVRVAVSCKRLVELVIGRSVVSEDDGSFALEDVTTDPAFLRLEGDAIVPELFRELPDGADLAALELTVGRRRRVQFEWGDAAGRGDVLQVVDEHGAPLVMMRLQGGGMGEVPTVEFQETPTEVLVVSDRATHAVVTRDGQEVQRLRLRLAANELNLVRL